MNTAKVIKELKNKYPDKFILENKISDKVTEILCEVEPTSQHPGWSTAIAVIDKSTPHHHLKTTETYKIIKGELVVHLNIDIRVLKEGDELTITTGIVHWAEGNETWIECRSEPGWTLDDHIID